MNQTCSADGQTRSDCEPVFNQDRLIVGYLCADHRYTYGFCDKGECLLLSDFDSGSTLCKVHLLSEKSQENLASIIEEKGRLAALIELLKSTNIIPQNF